MAESEGHPGLGARGEVIYAFLIALGVGGLTSAIFAALWKGSQLATVKAWADLEASKKELATAKADGEIAALRSADDAKRLNAVIEGLKLEISGLENDVATCRSPDAVRARLRGLLGR